MTSLRTRGGPRRGAIATTTTGRRATATVAMATSIKWSFLATGRIEGGVRTGAGGLRGGGIASSTSEAGRPPDTGAESAAGERSGGGGPDSTGGGIGSELCLFSGSGIAIETAGGPSHLTDTGRDPAGWGHSAGGGEGEQGRGQS